MSIVNSGAIFPYLVFFLLQRLCSWSHGIYRRPVSLSLERKPPSPTLIHAEFGGINLKTSEKQLAKKERSVFWGFKIIKGL